MWRMSLDGRLGKRVRRPDPTADQSSPENLERSSPEGGNKQQFADVSTDSGSDQTDVACYKQLDLKHSSNREKKTIKRVRFQLPKEGQTKSQSNKGTRKHMNKMWSTLK